MADLETTKKCIGIDAIKLSCNGIRAERAIIPSEIFYQWLEEVPTLPKILKEFYCILLLPIGPLFIKVEPCDSMTADIITVVA